MIPTAYAVTGLTGIPFAFIAVAVILALFCPGYMAMSRRIRNSGSFYAFVTAGLGKVPGVGAALMALVAYESFQVAAYGALSVTAQAEAAAHLHVNWPWWAWALMFWALVAALGLARVEVADRVLAVLTAAEIIIVLVETISGLARPAGGHLDFGALSPSTMTAAGAGTAGVLAVIALTGFVGFEQSPVVHALADGLVYTTPDRIAAALWIPGTGPAEHPEDYDEELAEVTDQWAERFVIFDGELDAHHLDGVAHHHLAVRPDWQGRGIGTALLDAHHAFLDQEGTAAYLEASDEGTRSIYLRHGYTDYGSPIQLPDGPPMYPMTREPRGEGG